MRHTQPRNTIYIKVRAGQDELNPILVPLQLLPQLPAIIQAHLFQAQADELMRAEEAEGE